VVIYEPYAFPASRADARARPVFVAGRSLGKRCHWSYWSLPQVTVKRRRAHGQPEFTGTAASYFPQSGSSTSFHARYARDYSLGEGPQAKYFYAAAAGRDSFDYFASRRRSAKGRIMRRHLRDLRPLHGRALIRSPASSSGRGCTRVSRNGGFARSLQLAQLGLPRLRFNLRRPRSREARVYIGMLAVVRPDGRARIPMVNGAAEAVVVSQHAFDNSRFEWSFRRAGSNGITSAQRGASRFAVPGIG